MALTAASSLLNVPQQQQLPAEGFAHSQLRCCAVSARVNFATITRTDWTRTLEPMLFPFVGTQIEEGEDDDQEELTFVSYGVEDDSTSSSWMTAQYLDLRLRCSSLLEKEACEALARHCKGRTSPSSLSQCSSKILRLRNTCNLNVELQEEQKEKLKNFTRPKSRVRFASHHNESYAYLDFRSPPPPSPPSLAPSSSTAAYTHL